MEMFILSMKTAVCANGQWLLAPFLPAHLINLAKLSCPYLEQKDLSRASVEESKKKCKNRTRIIDNIHFYYPQLKLHKTWPILGSLKSFYSYEYTFFSITLALCKNPIPIVNPKQVKIFHMTSTKTDTGAISFTIKFLFR